MKQPSSHRTQLYGNGSATALDIAATPPTPPTPTRPTPPTPLTPPTPRTPPTPPTPSSTERNPPDARCQLTIVENAPAVAAAAIAELAYELYTRSGRLPGRCEQNWLEAERQLAAASARADRRATAAASDAMVSEGGA